ncbi:hypothetical protein ABZ845_23855 [Streptomyces sp. NPDC047022]|uniref:hypothetical protein n=1 Tax=Streptomyces sp. NPDC047022 TaxID=3155737 RepID=UPI0033D26C39
MFTLRALIGAALTVASVTVGTTAPATANSGGDHVRCSEAALKQAVFDVNAAGGGTLRLAKHCTYTLTTPDNDSNGLPVITTKITILGNDSTIRRVSATDFRIFQIDGPNGDLTLKDLTVRDGHTSGRGGGIWLRASGARLTLDAVTLTKNFSDLQGGAIASDNGNAVTVRASKLSYNTARFSGAMDLESSIAEVRNSDITGNTSRNSIGGIYSNGTLTLDHSRVTDNSAGLFGGGIYSEKIGAGTATATLNDTVVRGNTAAGTNTLGGGIYNTGGSTLVLNRTQVFANRVIGSGGQGGGIANDFGSIATLTDSSVTYNFANTAPGGIFNSGATTTLISTVVTNNNPTNCTPSAPPVTGCVN